MKKANLAALLMAGLILAGCSNESVSNKPAVALEGMPAGVPASHVAVVTGTEGNVNLGRVAAGSKTMVVYQIANNTDRPLTIQKVRCDCACVALGKPPEQPAPPHGAVNVTATYEAPPGKGPYDSHIMVLTDDPDRRVIMLGIISRG